VGRRDQSRAEQIVQLLEHESNRIGSGKIIGHNLDLLKLSIVKKFLNKIFEHEQQISDGLIDWL
ncbi:unnamed protein product, partial [Rotaria sp. Silwood2]